MDMEPERTEVSGSSEEQLRSNEEVLNKEEKKELLHKKVKASGESLSSEAEEKPQSVSRWTFVFFIFIILSLILCFLIGLSLPLRPDYSESEKRPLSPMPSLTLASVMNGSYFEELGAWFSDTYPFREQLLTGNSRLENLYGLRDEAIYNRSDVKVVLEEIPTLSSETAPTLSITDYLKEVNSETGTGDNNGINNIDNTNTASPNYDLSIGVVSENSQGSYSDSSNNLMEAGNPALNLNMGEGSDNGDLTSDTGINGSQGQMAVELDYVSAEGASSGSSDSSSSDSGSIVSESTSVPETDAEGKLVLPELDTANVELEGQMTNQVYVSNNRACEVYYFSQSNMTNYASMINTVRAIFPDDVSMYSYVVPSAFGIMLPPEVQEKLSTSGMDEAIQYIYSLLDPKVKTVTSVDTLLQHKDEYIYFNTDHHWTQLGAYYAYLCFCKVKGIEPHAITDYEYRAYPGFYGSFYFATNRAEALKQNPDTIEAFLPIATNEMTLIRSGGQESKTSVIGDAGKFDAGNKYSCFIMGDNPLSRIENPNLNDGSAVVLIKDSFGNCFAPFLVDHYQYTYVVDYRYYEGNLQRLVSEKGIKDIVFMNCVDIVGATTAKKILQMFD